RLTRLCVGSVLFISTALASHAQTQSPGPAPTSAVPSSPVHVTAPAPALGPGPLSDALALYRKGDLDSAIQKYREILQVEPKSSGAYAGLTRVYLKRKDVQEASDTISQAVQLADDPTVHVALGEVYFRQGKIHDAEVEWAKVVNSGRQDARAYFGLARVRW